MQPFFDQTIRLQGRASHATHGSIWEALPTLDFLLNELEEKSKHYGAELTESPKKSIRNGKKGVQKPIEGRDASDTVHISTCIDSCWAKLRKYYRLMDQSPVYAAAVVLNPEHKWDYFKINWEQHPEWITQAEESVENLWLTMYKDSASSAEAEFKHDLNSGLFLPTPRKEPTDFDQWVSRRKYKRSGIKKKQDEYTQYLMTEHLPEQEESKEIQLNFQHKSINLCTFWARYETQYSSLTRMAFDILLIPVISAEYKRIFSSSKLLLTDKRARIKEDIIKASECLKA